MSPTEVDADQQQQLAEFLDQLEQGDVVHVDPLVILGAPATSLDPETAAAAEVTDEPVVPVARTSELGLYGIISQTCDIARAFEDEPFLHVCPLLKVTDAAWEAAREGRYFVRRFGYPGAIEGHKNLVLDVRVIQTIEKTALIEGSVKPVASGMNAPLRNKLAVWLGTRFSRYAFPDDLEEDVLEEDVLGDLRNQLRDKFHCQLTGRRPRAFVRRNLDQVQRRAHGHRLTRLEHWPGQCLSVFGGRS